MNLRFAALALLVGTAAPAYAGTAVYTQCGAHDGYILLYKSTEKFDELAKLRCGERLEVLNQAADYLQISTADGKTGWLLQADVTSDAPANASDLAALNTPVRSYSVPALTMTNQSILDLHHGHASSDAIVSKIRFSTCSFNTSEAGLHELKSAGVSDKVILAMLEVQKPLSASSDIHEVRLVVPGGTPVEVALSNEVGAEEVQQGTVVNMTVVKDVVVNGVTVITRGASARARVMGVRKPGSLERMGEVAWFMQDASAVTGDALPVGFAAKQPNMIPTGTFQGYAFLLSQYRKGAPALVPHDRTFIAVVSSDTVMHVPQSLARKPANSSADKTSAVLLDR
jgi:hypothetical protein